MNHHDPHQELLFCKVRLKMLVIAAVITAAIAAVIAAVKHVKMSLHIILNNFGFVK